MRFIEKIKEEARCYVLTECKKLGDLIPENLPLSFLATLYFLFFDNSVFSGFDLEVNLLHIVGVGLPPMTFQNPLLLYLFFWPARTPTKLILDNT